MSMLLNAAAVDALHSATYVEDFLDSVEWLPDDVQRTCSLMREIDAKLQEKFEEINGVVESFCDEPNTEAMNKKKYLKQIQKSLVSCQEMGDEKLQLVSQILDLIENKSRQLEVDLENLDNGKETENNGVGGGNGGSKSDPHHHGDEHKTVHKRPRRQRNEQAQKEIISSLVAKDDKVKPPKKKKRVKQRIPKDDDSPQFDIPVDPNEPRYCLCNQVSYGEMIGCDNDTCSIEWFHFNCVNLTTKPKGKWYCPTCVQERRDKRMR